MDELLGVYDPSEGSSQMWLSEVSGHIMVWNTLWTDCQSGVARRSPKQDKQEMSPGPWADGWGLQPGTWGFSSLTQRVLFLTTPLGSLSTLTGERSSGRTPLFSL